MEICIQHISVLACFLFECNKGISFFYLYVFVLKWKQPTLKTTSACSQSLYCTLTKVPLMWWKRSNLESRQRREAGDIYSAYRSSAVRRDSSCRRDIPIVWSGSVPLRFGYGYPQDAHGFAVGRDKISQLILCTVRSRQTLHAHTMKNESLYHKTYICG